MFAVPGTPVIINGKSGAPATQPGPATTTALRVPIPVPPGRQLGGTPIAPATTFARYLRLSNLDAANSLLVSFQDGNQVTILKGTTQEFTGNFPFFVVQSNTATTQWEGYAVVAS